MPGEGCRLRLALTPARSGAVAHSPRFSRGGEGAGGRARHVSPLYVSRAVHYANGNYSSQEWKAEAAKFVAKHRGHFDTSPVKHLRTAIVAVDDLSAARQVMRPPHWPSEC